MQSQQAWKDKLAFLNRNYIIITLSNAIYTFALTLALVQLALHGTTTLGMTMTLFGLVATANSVVVLAMRPFAGFLASRIDLRIINFVSMAIMAVAYLLLGFSAAIVIFVIGQIVRGVAFGTIGTILPVMVHNSVPEQQYQSALGFYFMVPMITVVPAPALGMWLYNVGGYALPTSIAAACTILAAVLSLFGKYTVDGQPQAQTAAQARDEHESDAPKRRGLSSVIAVKAVPLMVANIFVAICYSAVTSYMLVFDQSIGLGFYTIWATTYGTVSIFSSAISGMLAQKIGKAHHSDLRRIHLRLARHLRVHRKPRAVHSRRRPVRAGAHGHHHPDARRQRQDRGRLPRGHGDRHRVYGRRHRRHHLRHHRRRTRRPTRVPQHVHRGHVRRRRGVRHRTVRGPQASRQVGGACHSRAASARCGLHRRKPAKSRLPPLP